MGQLLTRLLKILFLYFQRDISRAVFHVKYQAICFFLPLPLLLLSKTQAKHLHCGFRTVVNLVKLIEHFLQSYSVFYVGLCFKLFQRFIFMFMHQFVVLSHSESFGGFVFVHTKS